MLHFVDRTVRDDAHRHVNARQQFVRSCDVLKFGIKQTRHFCAVNVLGIGLDHRHALFFTDDVDDFVEFYAFKTGKNLLLVNLFDSSGTLIGVTDKAGLADDKGKFPRMKQALYVDSISSVTGSFIGTSSVTAYIESSSGVSVGGRTGLTAVVVGLLFLLVIFLSPLAGMVPGYAAAGALIYVGVLMTSSLARVNWQDLTESVPAFITAVMMPFSFSITEGIALGFISYCVMKIGTGRLRDLSPCVIIVALLFILKIVFIDAH